MFIGVERHVATSYSGGGGGATQLELIRVLDDEAKPVLTAPIRAALTIRACFDERDLRARRGACHDEYGFTGGLALDPATASGPPVFVFETRATAFPAGASRHADSSARGRLRRRDMVHAPDPVCSYRRIMSFDPETEIYAPDAALPDCSAYTVP